MTLMVPIKGFLTGVIFQVIRASHVVSSTCVGHPIEAHGSRRVHSHHSMLIVVLIIADQLGQNVAVRFIDDDQNMFGRHNSIYRLDDFFLPIAL